MGYTITKERKKTTRESIDFRVFVSFIDSREKGEISYESNRRTGESGKKYDNTRHNIGFEALDYIADKEGISINTGKHKALIGTGYMGGEKVLLVKPQTFMNLSGESLRPIMDFYKLEPEDFIIIHDDIDLDVGRLRIRRKGSAGGHNGLKSIISHLGSMDFPRVKIGVGEKPKGYDLADYVLGHLQKKNRQSLRNVLMKCTMQYS